jgi:hypothetical protein
VKVESGEAGDGTIVSQFRCEFLFFRSRKISC